MGELPAEAELLVLKCNKVAMDYLRLERHREALNLLKKALDKLNSSDKALHNWPNRLRLLGITLNNFGCFYKRKGQPNVALYYLQKALNIELTTSNDSTNIAGTHLNICAILSQLNRHAAALQHAQKALEALKATHEMETGSDAEAVEGELYNGGINLTTTLIIAYHNVAAELEHLNRVDEAVEMYEKAEHLSRVGLSPSHPLSVSVKSHCEKAKARCKNLSELLSERQILRSRARVAVQEGSPTEAKFKGYEAIQKLPSIKHEFTKRVSTTVGSSRRQRKTGERFKQLNFSLISPRVKSAKAGKHSNVF